MASEPNSQVVEEARKTVGLYEVHVPAIGEQHQYEAGLNQECTKNPGHQNFIARNKFTVKDLPPGYQDQLMFDYVDTTAELTGFLTVRHVSERRPETVPGTQTPYPFSNVRGQNVAHTGTGRVLNVEEKFYTQGDDVSCPCGKCAVSDTPSSTWGKFKVLTAAHVLVDDSEVRTSDMRLYYRSGGRWDPQVKVVYGVEVKDSNIGKDWCRAEYVTHERSVYDTLRETDSRWRDLHWKVYYKYGSYNNKTAVVGAPAIVVSHPHTAHQYVTVGKITHVELYDKWPYNYRYTYSTDTCPGSSGATVITPGWYGVVWDQPPHSQACPDGQPGNQSAFF